jgi:uncharacterized LabA/DUF88 family protein
MLIKHKEQRVGVFVDVQNLYYSAKNLYQAKVNFGALLQYTVSNRKLIRAIAYVIRGPQSDDDNFFSALEHQGFEIKAKDLQVYAGGNKKGDWDVGLVIDAIKMANNLDVVILISGDGDYVPAVEYLQYHGVLVEVAAFGETCSTKLKEAADDFVDISKMSKKFLIK